MAEMSEVHEKSGWTRCWGSWAEAVLSLQRRSLLTMDQSGSQTGALANMSADNAVGTTIDEMAGTPKVQMSGQSSNAANARPVTHPAPDGSVRGAVGGRRGPLLHARSSLAEARLGVPGHSFGPVQCGQLGGAPVVDWIGRRVSPVLRQCHSDRKDGQKLKVQFSANYSKDPHTWSSSLTGKTMALSTKLPLSSPRAVSPPHLPPPARPACSPASRPKQIARVGLE